jgi:hypothetical protein
MNYLIKTLGTLAIATFPFTAGFSLLYLNSIEAREPDIVVPREQMISTCPDDVGYAAMTIGINTTISASRHENEIKSLVAQLGLAEEVLESLQYIPCTHTIIHRHGESPTGERVETNEFILIVSPTTQDLATAELIANELRKTRRTYVMYFNERGE